MVSSRGVDITVVFLMRDRSISEKERLKDDCPVLEMAEKESKMALLPIKDANPKLADTFSFEEWRQRASNCCSVIRGLTLSL